MMVPSDAVRPERPEIPFSTYRRRKRPLQRQTEAGVESCERGDSNPHGATPHEVLNLARLPIPPLSQEKETAVHGRTRPHTENSNRSRGARFRGIRSGPRQYSAVLQDARSPSFVELLVMALRRSSLRVVGLTCVLVLGSLVGTALYAQDRGAPRFGPAASADTVVAEPSDAGRLWSTADPPFDRFEERYEMEADSAWATHLRRGLLRLPGCTAALVSAEGLALTTARCVRQHLEAENDGAALVAEQRADERSVPALHADRLLRTTDVTEAVRAARQDTTRTQAVRSVEQRLQAEAEANRRVEVGSAAGAPYTAYTYRRFEDVRVAFLPEQAVSAFGGLNAAMTYPRQALDAALLRVYTAEGTPLAADHFFEPSTQGARPGDAVFSAGASEQTHRAESAEQLAVRRDLMLPVRRARLETWTRAMRASLDTATASARQHRALHEAERALKQTRARLEALQSEYVQTRLQRRDSLLRRALREDSSLQKRFGGVLDSLAAIQEAKRTLASAYRAFGRFGGESRPPSGSSTYRRILQPRRQEAAAGASGAEETTRGTPSEIGRASCRERV